MNTQNKRLLNAMKAGAVVDPMYALNQLGIYRLASRVYDLRKAGIAINKATRSVFNRFGEKTRVAAYWITKDA
jgi:hypothetical protein